MLVHLMLELYGVDPKILSDEPLVRRALDEFPQRIFLTDDVEAHFVVRGNRSLRPETPDPQRLVEELAARAERRSRKAGV